MLDGRSLDGDDGRYVGLDGFSFNQFNSINSGILIVTVRNGFGAFSDGLIRLIL